MNMVIKIKSSIHWTDNKEYNEFKFLKFQIVQSAGVYMYIIKAGEFRQIKKMVLLK